MELLDIQEIKRLVKFFWMLFYHPDIAEKLCTQITIANDSFLYHTQMGIYKLDNLILRPDLLGSHLIKLVGQTLQF